MTEQHIKVIIKNNPYTVNVIESSEGVYSGQCLELPGAISQGETIEELEKNIKEAILLVLEDLWTND